MLRVPTPLGPGLPVGSFGNGKEHSTPLGDGRSYDAILMDHAPLTLVVMAKAPAAGRSKTRLCPPCTPAQAAEVAAAALLDTLDVVAASPATRRVLALDGDPGAWLPDGFDVIAQRGDGLDERLAAVFAELDGPLLLVGMDTPQLEVAHLTDAAARLAEPGVDAVLGHARDGGWWAIGCSDPDPQTFTGVPMSTGETGRRQHDRLVELGMTVALLPELRDVDHWADAVDVAAVAPHGRFARTVAAISAIQEGVR